MEGEGKSVPFLISKSQIDCLCLFLKGVLIAGDLFMPIEFIHTPITEIVLLKSTE